MAEDWAIDVRKYAPNAEDAVIKAIVRYCGIALRNRDSSLVSFSDPAETARVRDNYCRKKLGLTDPDDVIDAAIASVGERMKADRTKNRVTVYYLLAEHFGKLGLFGATAAAAGAAAPADPDPVAPPPPPPAPDPVPLAAVPPAPPPPVSPAPVSAAPMAAAAAAAVPLAATGAPAGARSTPADEEADERGFIRFGTLALAVVGGGLLVAAVLGTLIGDGMNPPAPAPAVVLNPSAPPVGGPGALGLVLTGTAGAPAAPAVPDGAGVIATEVEGRPKLSVYFDIASAVVTPDFATVAAPLKAWIESNPTDRLIVSGYNDPRGDPAFNAELSKNRAQSVQAALEAIGVPAAAIDLEKPAETTDATTTLENARRVDIVVRPAG